MTIPPLRQEEDDGASSAVGEVANAGSDPFHVPSVVTDLIEVYCEEILLNAEKRIERSFQLKYFLARLGSSRPRGRVLTRCLLARLMFHVRGRDDRLTTFFSAKAREVVAQKEKQSRTSRSGRAGRSEDKQDDDSNELGELGLVEGVDYFKPLVRFSPTDWKNTLEMLEMTRDHILRKDANILIIPQEIDGWPLTYPESDDEQIDATTDNQEALVDAAVNESLASSSLVRKKYKGIEQAIKIHWALSLLVTEAGGPQDGLLGGVPLAEALQTPPSNQALQAYCEFIEEHFRDAPKILGLLNRIVVRADSRTRSGGLSLAKKEDLGEILARREFSLSRFQDKFGNFILDCADEVVDTAPRLLKKGFAPDFAVETSDGDICSRDVEGEGNGANVPSSKNDDSNMDVDNAQDNGGISNEAIDNEKKTVDGNCDNAECDDDGGPATVTASRHDDGKDPSQGDAATTHVDGSSRSSVGSKVLDLETLTEARLCLLKDVEDPLPESRAVVSGAARGTERQKETRKEISEVAERTDSDRSDAEDRTNANPLLLPTDGLESPKLMKKRKGRTTRLTFTSSEEEDENLSYDEPQPNTDTSLSKLPPKIAFRRPLEARRKGKIQRSHKRRRWTEEEKAAVRSGVDRFGPGQWAEIKGYYSLELQSRTSVQIKDCYRTMLKNDEI